VLKVEGASRQSHAHHQISHAHHQISEAHYQLFEARYQISHTSYQFHQPNVFFQPVRALSPAGARFFQPVRADFAARMRTDSRCGRKFRRCA
jgi:hypothetical protein